MRCSPSGSNPIARTAIEGGTPHGREGYHTGRVRGSGTAAGERNGRGRVPVLAEMRVDEKGFTEGLQELALLAGVMEPYQVGHEELLGRFAGVAVSAEKIERLVAQEGQRAEQMLQESPAGEPVAPRAAARGPCYVGIDGGMIFVEGRWQEVKLGCIYQA